MTAARAPRPAGSHDGGAAAVASVGARIGPNAIVRTAEALRDRAGEGVAASLLRDATGRTWATLPTRMVDEAEVLALVHAVHGALGEAVGGEVLRDAGVRTADYLRAHRIPRAAQRLIAIVPRALGLRLLLGAMARHAWTFAGSGRFTWAVPAGAGVPVATLAIAGCPMCRGLRVRTGACAFYAGAFERLARTIVDDRLRAREVACAALGAPACRFELFERCEPSRADAAGPADAP